MIPTGQTKRPPLRRPERRALVVPISRPPSLPERIEKIVRRGVPVLHIIHYPLKGSNGGVQPGGVRNVSGPTLRALDFLVPVYLMVPLCNKTPRLPAPPSPADPSSATIPVSVSALILALRLFLGGPLSLAHVALDRRLKSRPQVFSVHLV